MDAKARLFVRNLASAQSIAHRFSQSKSALRHLMPLDAVRMDALSDMERTHFDAFIKRFENLQDMLDSQILRGLLVLEEVELTGKTPRDLSKASSTVCGSMFRPRGSPTFRHSEKRPFSTLTNPSGTVPSAGG